METLTKKIDFAVVIAVNHANPNGDPLNGNRPRADYEYIGEISDVCLKRKIRNRIQDEGENIFVQSDERAADGYTTLSQRFNGEIKEKDAKLCAKAVCEKWYDVRAFGQVFAFKPLKNNKGEDGSSDEKGVSMGIRGPVSLMPAFSCDAVNVTETQITKSVNSELAANKSSDTMGMKHRVEFGLYVTYGSVNTQLASVTGFTDADAEKLKYALLTLFRNDSSAARPAGSMEVVKLIWWEHNCAAGNYPSSKVHRSLKIIKKVDGAPKKADDYEISVEKMDGLKVSVLDGE